LQNLWKKEDIFGAKSLALLLSYPSFLFLH